MIQNYSMALNYAINDTDILDNCVSWWPLNEYSDASGAVTRYDAHGTSDLSDNDTVASAAGNWNRGADFDSTNTEWLSKSSDTALGFSNDFTVSLWFKVETDITQFIVERGSTSDSLVNYRVYYSSGGTVTFGVRSSGSFYEVSDTGLSTGTWYHLVGVKRSTGTGVELYINGVSQDTDTRTAACDNSGSATFQIGGRRQNGTTPLNGIVQDVAVFDTTLSTAQIGRLYNSGDGMTYGIDYDTGTSIASWTSSASPSGTHVCTGENRFLVVKIFSAAARTITGVTYNGVSMVADSNNPVVDPDLNKGWIYTLENPASGSNTVAVSSTGSSNMSVVAASYIGVHQTDAIDAVVADSGTGIASSFTSSSITVASANNWLIDGLRDVDNSTLTSSELTFKISSGTVYAEIWDSNGTVASGAQTITINMSPNSRLHGNTLLSINPVAAPAATSSIVSVTGVAQANVTSYNGITNANISSVNGVSNT